MPVNASYSLNKLYVVDDIEYCKVSCPFIPTPLCKFVTLMVSKKNSMSLPVFFTSSEKSITLVQYQ